MNTLLRELVNKWEVVTMEMVKGGKDSYPNMVGWREGSVSHYFGSAWGGMCHAFEKMVSLVIHTCPPFLPIRSLSV